MTLVRGLVAGGLALAVLGACSPRPENPILMNVAAAQRGPDEFSILPTRPLQAPPSLSALPTPTPGGTNLVDPDPRADVAVALGGRADAVRGGGTAADGALIAHVSRRGVAPDIRSQLAAEDLEFRQRNNGRILERAFATNVYQRAYREQALDQYAELERWRRAGARTPAAPPADNAR